MRRAFVLTFAAGAVLSTPACKDTPPDDTPVRKPADKPSPSKSAPADPDPAPSGLPRFEDVKSPHPPGATNPPSPFLIVSPDGRCFVRWEGGMVKSKGNRVEDCDPASCGTEIQCPPEAKTLLGAYSASASATASAPPPPKPKASK